MSGEMNNATTTTQVATSTFSQGAMASSVSPQSSPRINLPPPANPPFAFPTRVSSSAPSSLSRSTGRRHQSAIEIPSISLGVEYQDPSISSTGLPDFSFAPDSLSPEGINRRRRPAPLPDFSFNPGATPTKDASLLSPSFSPPSPRTAPIHMGHRRGGSEFVGGKLKTGEPITMMSTSPTRSESGFASPSLAPPSGPHKNHYRRHSHKRSGAISSHDLAKILQTSPSPVSKGSSAPASPAAHHVPYTFPDIEKEQNTETTSESNDIMPDKEDTTPEKPSQSLPELSSRPVTRARVGFSDTLEFIPRPLSLVSTDTASTVRPGHSVSGSISSIVSVGNSMNPDRESAATRGTSALRTTAGSRPSTAGAILERTSSLHVPSDDVVSAKRRNSMLILNDLAQANPPTSAMSTPTKTPKRWSFFGFDSFVTTGSPTKPRRASASSSDKPTGNSTDALPSNGSGDGAHDPEGFQDLNTAEGEKKRGKKRQKRVKTWAGSILTRKSKSRKSKARRHRSQTPPITRFEKDDEPNDEFPKTSVESPWTKLSPNPDPPRSFSSGVTKHRRADFDDEASFTMIDLDAALGPFNTPSRDPQWDEAQKAGAPPKRQLHSAAGLRGFSGPGMHYHRRAESAPEMPPFEMGRFGIHRFGSSSTMADVFEEDEEEDDDNATESAADDSTSESQGTTTGDEDEGRDTDDAASTPRQEHTTELASLQSDILATPPILSKERSSSVVPRTPVKMNDDHTSNNPYREALPEDYSPFLAARREAMFTSPFEASNLSSSSRKDIMQMESIPPDATSIMLPGPAMPTSPYAVSHSSSFPSPCSPTSYDTHRISTAPSSVTDENQFRSLLMGEPGPELVRLSVDLASVHSANSNSTPEGSFTPAVRPRNMPFHEQRPASFTTSAFGRRRSSLASLSRLISSAHGERSKLSMEVPFDEEDKKTKASKSKRLTRMMQFWKPKSSSGS